MANVNSTVKFFQNGGKVTLTDGGSNYVILNIMDGSVEVEPGFREVHEYDDRGIMQTPIRGKDMPTKIKLKLRVGSGISSSSGEFVNIIRQAGVGDLVKLFTNIIIEIPDSRGGSTGHRLTQTNIYSWPESNKFKAGTPWDEMDFECRSIADYAGFVTY